MSVIPKVKVDKYPLNSTTAKEGDKSKSQHGWSPILGFTLTGRKSVGPGIGVGVGLVDVWFGWPKEQERLCRKGCTDGNHVWVDQSQ